MTLRIETVKHRNRHVRVYKPRQRKKRRSSRKDAIWSLRKADKHFSEFLRERDKRCMHPVGCERKTMLQCSHYIGRATKSTRFDPDNCITLCWLHHYKDKLLGFEFQKQTLEKHGFDGGYTLFMKKHLGEERFIELCERAKQSIKQKAAIINYMKQHAPKNT